MLPGNVARLNGQFVVNSFLRLLSVRLAVVFKQHLPRLHKRHKMVYGPFSLAHPHAQRFLGNGYMWEDLYFDVGPFSANGTHQSEPCGFYLMGRHPEGLQRVYAVVVEVQGRREDLLAWFGRADTPQTLVEFLVFSLLRSQQRYIRSHQLQL